MNPRSEGVAQPDPAVDSTVKDDFTPCGRCLHPRYVHRSRCDVTACGCSGWRKSRPARRDLETMDYLGAARRFIRAAGRRVGECDEPELAALLALQTELDAAIAEAVVGQKSRKSWAQIALGTGTTREAAFQRWNPALIKSRLNLDHGKVASNGDPG